MAYIDSVNKNSTDYALSSFGNIILNEQNADVSKTITFPNGYDINDSSNNLTFRVLFKNGHKGQSNMTLNGLPIYVNQQGTLVQLPYHYINSTYKSLQPNTILEMYYTSDITGGAFVIVGNPIVLSGENYTIYADGYNVMEKVYPVGSVYQNATSNTDPSTLFGIGTWVQITDKFLMASGSTYTTSGGSSTVTLAVCHLPSHCHTGPSHCHETPIHCHSLSGTFCTDSCGSHCHLVCFGCNTSGNEGKIRACTGGETCTCINAITDCAGLHCHTVTLSGNTGNASPTTCASGTGNTGNTGSGCAFNIIPPYCAVYTWYRCA